VVVRKEAKSTALTSTVELDGDVLQARQLYLLDDFARAALTVRGQQQTEAGSSMWAAHSGQSKTPSFAEQEQASK
jgi:hypothetical protein